MCGKVYRSCPEELGREQWRQGSRGTAGSLGVPRGGLRPGAGSSSGRGAAESVGEGVGEAGQTGPRRRVGFSPGGDRSQGRVSSRTRKDLRRSGLGKFHPAWSGGLDPGMWPVFSSESSTSLSKDRERWRQDGERPRGCSESGWEKTQAACPGLLPATPGRASEATRKPASSPQGAWKCS